LQIDLNQSFHSLSFVRGVPVWEWLVGVSYGVDFASVVSYPLISFSRFVIVLMSSPLVSLSLLLYLLILVLLLSSFVAGGSSWFRTFTSTSASRGLWLLSAFGVWSILVGMCVGGLSVGPLFPAFLVYFLAWVRVFRSVFSLSFNSLGALFPQSSLTSLFLVLPLSKFD